MPLLRWQGRALESDGETVLETLERAGHSVPSSCRAGACQTCLLRAVEGTPPPASQRGVRPSLAAQGCFLACLARLDADLTAAPADALPCARVVVRSVEHLATSVARVLLEPEEPFAWRAGQFLQVLREDGLARPYSLASATGSSALELHVKRVDNRGVSAFLCDEARPGTRLTVRGPLGDCVYEPECAGRPLVLAGTGTGLAPLLGVVRDALAAGHAGPLELHHGALEPEELYADAQLRALAERHPALSYRPSVLRGPAGDPRVGDLRERVLASLRAAPGARVYLCGAPETVRRLQRDAFLAGFKLSELRSDAFLSAPASR